MPGWHIEASQGVPKGCCLWPTIEQGASGYRARGTLPPPPPIDSGVLGGGGGSNGMFMFVNSPSPTHTSKYGPLGKSIVTIACVLCES